MEEEKRTHPRFEIKQLVEVDFAHEKFVSAEGVNISKNGILCKTDEECPLYSKVFIMMTLPFKEKERIINLEGIIVRSMHDGARWDTGISITEMSDPSRKIFDDMMKHLVTEPVM